MFETARDFAEYYRSRQGRHVAMHLRGKVDDFWYRGANGSNAVVGYGPAVLGRDDLAAHPVAMLPERLGAQRWPGWGACRQALVDIHDLPLLNVQLDRLLVVHALEFDPDPVGFLGECWRVLDGGGRLMVVVPNRMSMWARAEKTPFGHGRPFSGGQLRSLLKKSGFDPAKSRCTLYMPPSALGVFLRFGTQIERIGGTWWPGFGGALVVEAQKNLYAPAGGKAKARRTRAIPGLAARPSGTVRELPD